MNPRRVITTVAVVVSLGIGTLLVRLRPRATSGTHDAEPAGAHPASATAERNADAQVRRVGGSRADSNHSASAPVAVDPDTPRTLLELPGLALAVDSFRFVDSLKDSFPAVSNGRKRLEALQQKLFRDDLAFASSLDERISCDKASVLMESLKQSGGDAGGTPAMPPGDATSRSPLPAHLRSGALVRVHDGLISDANQTGFSAIAGMLASRLNQAAAGSGAFQDACLYAGLRTYLEDILTQHERESAVMVRRLKDQFAAENPQVPEKFAKSSEAESQEYRQVLESYRAIFSRRMERWLGADGAEVITQLDRVKLPGVGSELSVPCGGR